MSFTDRAPGRAWARLLAEKHDPEVGAVIGDAVKERSGAWYAMITRAVARGELPRGTDPRLLLGMIGAVVDAWNANAPAMLTYIAKGSKRSGYARASIQRLLSSRVVSRSSLPPRPIGSSTRVRFRAEVPHGTMRERLEATCDLHDVAIAQLVARLRRSKPDITDAEIDAWLQGGDPGWGRPIKLPR